MESCIIKVSKNDLSLLDESKYQMGLMKETEHDTSIEMHFTTFSLDYFARGILFSNVKFDMISPSSLKEKLIDIVRKMNPSYL